MMKNRLARTIFLWVFVAAALAVLASAQEAGCCCNATAVPPEAHYTSPQLKTACNENINLTFITPTTRGKDICINECGALAPSPIVVPSQCGSPGYAPNPQNFRIDPLKGELGLWLKWDQVCPASAYVIERCDKSTCNNNDFTQIAVISASPFFVDRANLLWAKEYTYRLTARYGPGDESAKLTSKANTGDIECRGQLTDANFCISSSYYDGFKNYFQQNGYKSTAITEFVDSKYSATINSLFIDTTFNRAHSCTRANVRQTVQSCASSEVCLIQNNQVQCINPASSCQVPGVLFGIQPSVDSCEKNTQGKPNYCFLDKSTTSTDACYSCTGMRSCYDYKSEGACERNSCGLGSCVWEETFGDIGSGVCIDERYNNCALCDYRNTNAKNDAAYNEIFDSCSEEKAAALSTEQFTCFYDPNSFRALDCSSITCTDYRTQSQCRSPPGGVQLDSNNSVVTGSSDPCGIKVCQYTSFGVANITTGCFKNADGSKEVDPLWKDCTKDNRTCELDYFPPETSMISSGTAGMTRRLDIYIFDRVSPSDPGRIISGAGYRTFVCSNRKNASACTNWIKINTSFLTVSNLELKQGTAAISNFSVGLNSLRFYSIDPAGNPEVIKETTIDACEACQGPQVINLTITPSNLIENTYYSNSQDPRISVLFDDPADISIARLVAASENNLLKTPASGLNNLYSLRSSSLVPEGNYTFALNAKNAKGIFLDAELQEKVVIDTTPPTATYDPAADAVLKTNKATVKINFSEKVLVKQIVLETFKVYDTDFGKVRNSSVQEITSFFRTQDNKTFTSTQQITLAEGINNIHVVATDYAGNPLLSQYAKSSIIVDALPPIITIVRPSYGVSSQNTFPLIFETDSNSTCRLWTQQNIPVPPVFGSLQAFDTTSGFRHTLNSFTINEVNKPYDVYVECNDDDAKGSGNFKIIVDKSPPSIITAFAIPNPIIQKPLETTLKVQTNEQTFCRYSTTASSYDNMESEFPLFGIVGKFAHTKTINLTEEKDTKFNIACKNLADLGPVNTNITVNVDLNQTLKATSRTEQYHKNLTFPIGIETNKDAFCYFTVEGSAYERIGDANAKQVHNGLVSVSQSGSYVIDVLCNTGAAFGQAPEDVTLKINVIVDTTPPWMLFVSDNSTLLNDTGFSYFLDRLRVAYLGAENESRVTRYFYKIEDRTNGTLLINWTPDVRHLDGNFWVVQKLNLTNKSTYFFTVKPENIVGLNGTEMSSDGVTVDTGKTPVQCANGLLDLGETDVDCGGICPQCADLLKCSVDEDCQSDICESGICQQSTCEDNRAGGEETDVDCGGPECDKCDESQACLVDSDCTTNYCQAGICVENTCRNGLIDGSESDIDCGGACPIKCTAGKSCVRKDDCVTGALCINNICSVVEDADGDGVPDDVDQCPNTPRGEAVDETGCSASQRFSCGDAINDAWRIRYFGSVLCDGDGAANADPDNDGRTNLQEFLDRTNPLQSDKKPFPWLTLIIILLLLSLASLGGWYFYKHPEIFRRKKAPPARIVKPAEVPKPLAKPEATHIEKWISMDELKKLGKEDMSAKTFEKLDKLIEGTLPSKEHPQLLKRMEKEGDPLDRLRQMALKGMSQKERKELLEKLKLLKLGKLSKAERDELFRKLRITASYYEKNKALLEKELGEFARGEYPKKRRKR